MARLNHITSPARSVIPVLRDLSWPPTVEVNPLRNDFTNIKGYIRDGCIILRLFFFFSSAASFHF